MPERDSPTAQAPSWDPFDTRTQSPTAGTKPKIGTIEINFNGEPNVPEPRVRDLLLLRPGDDLTSQAVDLAVRSVYRSGVFETIEVKPGSTNPDGTTNLVFVVTPKKAKP